METQVLLDRLLFSPGAIDGLKGRNADFALKAFQEANDLDVSGEMDDKTSETLRNAAQVDGFLQSYTLTEADLDSQFLESIPEDMGKSAELDALSYGSVQEMIAERFHTTADSLKYLNPGAEWKTGDVLQVPNVFPTEISNVPPGSKAESTETAEKNDDDQTKDEAAGTDDKATTDGAERRPSGLKSKPEGPVTIFVSKQDTYLRVWDKDGKILFHAPVSAGSEHDPLPLGDWKVNGTEKYPKYNYNPDLFWDADESDKKAKVPAGPNNPVGVAWVDITKPHYGLHGTPNPEKIGYTESHGCVRLTNWDVLRLADMVKPGTNVEFREKAEEKKKQ